MIDIDIQQIPTKGHALEPYQYKLVHDCGYSKEDAVTKKRELEQAQKAVYIIMDRIKELDKLLLTDHPLEHISGCSYKEELQQLHSILQKAMK